MKKRTIIISAVISAIVFVFFCFYFALTAPKNAGDFSVSQHREELENSNFQTDKNYGKVTDFKSAAQAGKTALVERFENVNGSIFEWMGCRVWHDKEADAYYVRVYHLNPRVKGGAFGVIMKSDGTVLAIWGEK